MNIDKDTTWLQFCSYSESEVCGITDFEVETAWLKSVINQPLEEFLDTYTSDESTPIYELALLKEKILNEQRS